MGKTTELKPIQGFNGVYALSEPVVRKQKARSLHQILKVLFDSDESELDPEPESNTTQRKELIPA